MRPPVVSENPTFQLLPVPDRPCTEDEVHMSSRPTGQRPVSVSEIVAPVTAAAFTIRSPTVGVMLELNVASMNPTPEPVEGDAVTVPNSINVPARLSAIGSPTRKMNER